MKKQHLFTLDISTIQQLHRRIARGHRSQFVQTAIQNRLDNDEEYDIEDITNNRMAVILLNRLTSQDDDTPFCGILRCVLLEWINQ